VAAGIASGLEFFRQVLELRGYRQQLLTADIANASTPGFKAVDLDFRQALAAAGASGPVPAASASGSPLLLVDDVRHILPPNAVASPAPNAVKYQIGGSVTLDGNSVEINREKTEAAENAVQYEAAATFTSQVIKMMTTAMGGAGPASPSGV
jgi:flagellar basal-body rod protein FlgB